MRMGDREVLAQGAKLGRAYLGIGADGALHPELVDPDVTDLATAAAVREAGSDARVFDAVSAALARSDDSQKRGGLLVALASTRDPALVQRALDLALAPGLRKNERLTTILGLFDDETTREASWTWLQAHFDALVPMLPDRYAGYVPPRLGFCDATRADEVQAFFAPRVPSLTGGTRNLAQGVEAMHSCAKVAETQRASAEAFAKGL
jgi:alanyl aminopeptidase